MESYGLRSSKCLCMSRFPYCTEMKSKVAVMKSVHVLWCEPITVIMCHCFHAAVGCMHHTLDGPIIDECRHHSQDNRCLMQLVVYISQSLSGLKTGRQHKQRTQTVSLYIKWKKYIYLAQSCLSQRPDASVFIQVHRRRLRSPMALRGLYSSTCLPGLLLQTTLLGLAAAVKCDVALLEVLWTFFSLLAGFTQHCSVQVYLAWMVTEWEMFGHGWSAGFVYSPSPGSCVLLLKQEFGGCCFT